MANSLAPATDILSGSIGTLLKFWWVLAAFAVVAIIGSIVWWTKKYKQKNGQWTHKLHIKFEQPNGDIDPKETIINMRRWKHKEVKTAPLFELENPLIGSRIFIELEKYSSKTAYEVILGNDGRLYIPTIIKMCRDANALLVSVKHAGVDRARQEYNNDFEKQNATPTKIDALTLMKYGLYLTILIVVLVLGITGLKSWGERASYDATAAQAEVASWESMGETMDAVNSALNTVTLILPDLKNMYGNNIQGTIKGRKEDLNQS